MMTFLMSIFCVALSYSQQNQRSKVTPEERAGKRIEMMKKSLNLTDEQVTKLQEAQKQLFSDMRQIRGTGEAKREEMKAKREEMKADREKMRAKRDAYNEQLKTILTPEQYQQYQEQRKDMQKYQQKKTPRGRCGEHQKDRNKEHHSKKDIEV